jgi:EthD domain
MGRVTAPTTAVLLVVAWCDGPPAPPPGPWRVEPVLPDQSALDRAGSKGRTPPPFHALLWRDDPDAVVPLAPPEAFAPAVDRWGALRLSGARAWDDTTDTAPPRIKQVSLVAARAELAPDEFARHYREHVAVARVHHPGIVRYAQHTVLETAGDDTLAVQAVSELWFADEATLVDRYFAGPDSVAVVRADNREYIDFSRTLSLLVQPADSPGA